MNFDEIKARHEETHNQAYVDKGLPYSYRGRQSLVPWGVYEACHADRAWLIAEVERLRELASATQKALQIANTGMARMTLRKSSAGQQE